jgi:hypothetical protein
VAAISLLALGLTVAAQASPRSGGGGGARIASNLCSHLQVRLGDRFAARFGSASECESNLVQAAQTAIAACKGSDSVRSCVKANVKASIKPARLARAAGKLAKVRAAIQGCVGTATRRTPEFRACVKSALQAAAATQ